MSEHTFQILPLPFVNATQLFNINDIVRIYSKAGISLDLIAFDEEKVFPEEDVSYPPFPVLVVEKGSRDIKLPVTKDEVEDLYWS